MIRPTKFDLTHQRFGRLVVFERAHDRMFGGQIATMWLCRCDCGKDCEVRAGKLRSGHTQSCGCLRVENAAKATTTHGLRNHPLYRVWLKMKGRCHCATDRAYRHYGARGIFVCSRWRESFAAFLDDMGERPSPRHSVERIDNDGPYSPSNCKWATIKEQSRNRRVTVHVVYRGARMPLQEALERAGNVISGSTAMSRIREYGWPVDLAIESAPNCRRQKMFSRRAQSEAAA